MYILLFVIFCLLLVPHGVGAVTGMYCYRCFDQANPADCQQISICGEDEVCFTREYTDHNGKRGYHLGCEDQAICTLFKDTQMLLGRRSVEPDAAPLSKCFDCCSFDQCNSRLCGNPTVNPGTSTKATVGVPMKPTAAYSGMYPSFGDSIYLISEDELSWRDAQNYCQYEGGDLVSITSPGEQNFLINQLIAFNATNAAYFWLGGINSDGTWKWSDGSPFNYTSEFPYFRDQLQARSDSLVMHNPAYISSLNSGKWSYDNPVHTKPFICEMDKSLGQ